MLDEVARTWWEGVEVGFVRSRRAGTRVVMLADDLRSGRRMSWSRECEKPEDVDVDVEQSPCDECSPKQKCTTNNEFEARYFATAYQME